MCPFVLSTKVSIVRRAVFVAALIAAASANADVCWRGRPKPDCNAFIVTEAIVGATLNKIQDDDIESAFYRGDAGYMFNLDPSHAVGGTVSLDLSFDEARLGINGRYRYWLTPFWTIDATPGIAFGVGGFGASAHAAVNAGDWVGVDLGYDYLPDGGFNNETVHLLRAGIKVGAYPGLGVGAILTTLLAVGIIAGGVSN